jgi:hypothetical protein
MQELTADPTGAIFADLPISPGREYSLFVSKHPGLPPINTPTAGSLNIYQFNEVNLYVPVLDHDGRAVTADLATSEGIAVTFIAHCDRFQLVAQGLLEEDGLMFSLLPLP